SKQRAYGLTLIECLTTILLLSTLTAMAIPSFETLRAKQTVRQAISTLQGSFARMKIHAINRGTEVVLCGTSDHTHCQQNWTTGFMSFEDTNHNRTRDANETLLEYHQPLQDNQGFQLHSCSRRYFRTSGAGPLASIAGRLAIVPPNRHAQLTPHIVVSRIGRTRIDPHPAQPNC
ncbi:MAG: GspH/FimT family pseudopilin, partial [Gammaproteobacteria bacterium]